MTPSYYVFPGIKLTTLTREQRTQINLGRRRSTSQEIMEAVCKYYNVPEQKVRSKSRKREYVWCRQVYYHLCSLFTTLSLKDMGMTLRQDHTTVIHSKAHVQELIETEQATKNEIRQIEEMIESIPSK